MNGLWWGSFGLGDPFGMSSITRVLDETNEIILRNQRMLMEIEFESERRRLLESERRRFESDQRRRELMQRKAEEHKAHMARLKQNYKDLLEAAKDNPQITQSEVDAAREAWLDAMRAHRKGNKGNGGGKPSKGN